ncbi:P-II family nitrogen regulator [Thioalkalivibrio sp.]|uniref:P-II family nitrogen regulator n=1 Tax=Thioalkalivibrio sp. TaxID=2093813 RepID=UPI00356B0835
MKFAVLVAILAEELEEKGIDVARNAGAEGLTIIHARGLGARHKKTFFGLTYEGSQTMLICVLERKLSLSVMKALTIELKLAKHSKGVVFTVPLDHIAGIDTRQLESFVERIKDEI